MGTDVFSSGADASPKGKASGDIPFHAPASVPGLPAVASGPQAYQGAARCVLSAQYPRDSLFLLSAGTRTGPPIMQRELLGGKRVIAAAGHSLSAKLKLYSNLASVELTDCEATPSNPCLCNNMQGEHICWPRHPGGGRAAAAHHPGAALPCSHSSTAAAVAGDSVAGVRG